MKTRFFTITAAAFISLLFYAGEASAQYQRRVFPSPAYLNRPPISPYMNLFRRDFSAAGNYYTLTRPQLQQQAFNQQQQQAYQSLRRDVSAAQQPGQGNAPPATGHRVMYMNYSHYYQLKPLSQP